MRCFAILSLLFFEISYAQHVVFPLQIGNRWHYQFYFDSSPDSGGYESRVIGDTIFSNGKSYAILYSGLGYQDYLRQDSERVYRYSPSNSGECILYQFDLHVRDTICQSEYMGEHLESIFGRLLRVYYFQNFIPGVGARVADSLGVFTYYYDLAWSDQLVGAIINGVTYGSIADVPGHNVGGPSDFHLAQNYPNPFNPSTSISYNISKTSWVNLTVFDLVGQQVAVLVNEVKYPGSYVVSWKPDALPSGIYFYQLRSRFDTNTKQMIYVK